MSDEDYDGDYDDGFAATASYSPEMWTPTETSALLVAGRVVEAREAGLTYGEVKAAVAAVEALGERLTLVLPGDTTTTGPSDDETCTDGLIVGVIVGSVWANDHSPERVDRARVLREAAAVRDVEKIAAALPEPLRAAYRAASDELVLAPVGPLPYACLMFGLPGRADAEGLPGEFRRGVDMQQESHEQGVWGRSIASGEFTDLRQVRLDEPDSADGPGYWLIARYD
jgi:hypothetical protein